MGVKETANIIFSYVADQNPDIASNLEILYERSKEYREKTDEKLSPKKPDKDLYPQEPPSPCPQKVLYSSSVPLIGIIIVSIALGAIIFANGKDIYSLFASNWKQILFLLGGVCFGAGIIIASKQIGLSPLKHVDPPNANTNNPLEEIEQLANRSVSRLKISYHMQLSAVIFVGCTLLIIVYWCIYMVSKDKLMYASAFGSSGVGMIVLTKWKWQPFEKVAEARKLADNADILATGLRLRINSLSEISDPKERAREQWVAVGEYLDRSNKI